MSLKSRLDSLSVEERRRLMHAFNGHITQYIELNNNMFIGVNINMRNFKIEEEIGVWSFGTITKGVKS